MSDFEGPEFQALLAQGRERGYVTYEQANAWLGEEATAEAIDQLVLRLGEVGIELIDEMEVAGREQSPPVEWVDLADFEPRDHPPVGDPAMHAAFVAAVVESPEDDTPR